jgi:azurin
MITLNLLPDLVLQRRKDAHTKKLTIMGLIVWAGILVLAILGAFGYELIQRGILSSALKAKTELSATVNSEDNVKFRTEALEVQTSLKELDVLYNKQSRLSLVNDRLAFLTPKTIILKNVTITSSQGVTLDGSASSYDEVGKYLVALRDELGSASSTDKITFTNVKLQAANLGEVGTVRFSMTASYLFPTATSTVSEAK